MEPFTNDQIATVFYPSPDNPTRAMVMRLPCRTIEQTDGILTVTGTEGHVGVFAVGGWIYATMAPIEEGSGRTAE